MGPRVRMEARGERQGRMTVWAAQEFLSTEGRGGPARELPPQGKVVRRQLVATAERRSSAQAGLEETASRLIFGHMRSGLPL